MAMRTAVEQKMGPEETVGKGTWRQVGANQRQIRLTGPRESEITSTKQPVKNPGGRWLLEVWKFGARRNLHVYNNTDTQGGSE